MTFYVVNRLWLALLTLLGLTLIVFVFLRVIPGSETTMLLGSDTSSSPQQVAELRHDLGLDRPIPVQYGDWIWGILRGDLGNSLFTGRPVTSEIVHRVPTSAELAVLALILAALVGVPAGVASALRRDQAADHVIRLMSIVGLAVPSFWLGTMVMVYGAQWFNWIPPVSYTSPFESPLRNFTQFIVPAAIVGLALAASLTRMTRSAVLEVVQEDYVRTARAKGLGGWQVLGRHIMRNSLIPVITLYGVQVGYVVAGTVLVEAVFSLPGLGRLILDSITRKDYPVVQGIILFYGTLIVFVNLAVDLIYVVVDPRLRLERAET